jgi:hypothetical protein
MLRILGNPKRLCNGFSRRELLRVGGLGLCGLGLADFLRLSEAQAAPKEQGRSFGKAKSCILLYLYGSPSQLETFDTKPGAPLEIRGELKSIRSNVPGMDVGELLPSIAKIMDRVTVVRSVTHPYPIHGVAFATTGVPEIDVPMELNPHDPRHQPFIGSVCEYLWRNSGKGRRSEVPDNVALPWPFSTERSGEVARAGPYAAYLGGAYNPIWTRFHGVATRTMTKTLTDRTIDFREPYMGIEPSGRFELANSIEMPAGLTLDRLNERRSLMQQFDQARADLERTTSGRSVDRYREMAYGLIGSTRIRDALDLGKEPLKLRESYGMTLFGQAALTARRLAEAGSRFVSVFWDEFGLAGSAWDTHWDHYNRMKKELCPGFDKALYGLVSDLDARGTLDDTLVVVLSEHGRTPKITSVKGGGRDHWSQCYSVVLAGGGIARGKVVGKSDKIAGTVAERPVSPKDLLATIYHLLGLDPHTLITDRTGRPVPILPHGELIPEALA